MKRTQAPKNMKELALKKGIPIQEFFGKCLPPPNLKLSSYNLLKLSAQIEHDEDRLKDLIWISSWLLKTNVTDKTQWSGYMQSMHSNKDSHQKSSVLMLPIIDLNPSNPTCLYSTLRFVESQAKALGIKTPCITFDQPLWYKAVGIIENENLNIVCRLGGFHLLMSFIGSIGHVMAGSGIEDALETVYASNVIHHILSGKEYARAVRGHMLIHAALLQLMLEELLDTSCINRNDLVMLAEFKPGDCMEDFKSKSDVISDAFESWKNSKTQNRRSKYWIQYMGYIEIVKTYIRAERTGDRKLHLSTVSDMLNLFAATGQMLTQKL